MFEHNEYIILNPYSDDSNEFFNKFPNGENMKLKLMCAGPENSFFFFPKNYEITTALERLNGHPLTEYSGPFSSIDEIIKAIDEWAPIDRKQKTLRANFLENNILPY